MERGTSRVTFSWGMEGRGKRSSSDFTKGVRRRRLRVVRLAGVRSLPFHPLFLSLPVIDKTTDLIQFLYTKEREGTPLVFFGKGSKKSMYKMIKSTWKPAAMSCLHEASTEW